MKNNHINYWFWIGILGGLSTFYGPPMLAYIVAVDLPKEKFVRTVSTMYFIGSFLCMVR